MIGRILRPAPGKTSALLIDLNGASHQHGMPEDERLFKLHGRAIQKAEVSHCAVCTAALVDGTYPCIACGYQPQGSKTTTRVTNDPLVRFARKIAEGPEQRRETLQRWIGQAVSKGYKPTSVFYKWKAVYSEQLPRALFNEAMSALRNA
jgi:superfamily II DNA or RNA helicase